MTPVYVYVMYVVMFSSSTVIYTLMMDDDGWSLEKSRNNAYSMPVMSSSLFAGPTSTSCHVSCDTINSNIPL